MQARKLDLNIAFKIFCANTDYNKPERLHTPYPEASMRIYMTLCITTRMQRTCTHMYVYKVQLKLNVYKRRVIAWMVAIDIYVPLVWACQNLLMEKTWVKVAAAGGGLGQIPSFLRHNKESKQGLMNKIRVKTWVSCYSGKKA